MARSITTLYKILSSESSCKINSIPAAKRNNSLEHIAGKSYYSFRSNLMYSFTSCTVKDCNTTALSGSDFCVLHLSDAANHIKALYETIRQQKTIKNINLAGVPLDGWILKQRQFFGCSFAGAQLNNIDWSDRSEERRVGKECRSRWSPYH